MGLLDQIEASEVYNESDDDEDAVPDAESVSDSSESEDEDLFLDNMPPAPSSSSIASLEGDDKTVHLLGGDMQPYGQNDTALSLLSIPYQLVLLVFPCIC